jgi:hypothetical protein
MRDANTIVRERQLIIRHQMDDQDISLRGVSAKSGINYETIVSYFPGGRDGSPHREPATMNAAAIYKLVKNEALPLDLVSMLLPDGYQIMRSMEGIDHETLFQLACDYIAEKNRAHHPDSEAGRDIGPTEAARLGTKAVQLVGSIAA